MEGRVVVVGNEKGGCGKTTISINLAALAASHGRDVLLVDADPGQQSAARWAARRRALHPAARSISCITLTGRIDAEIRDMRRRYAVVIIDTGAEDSPELRSAATVAGVLVVPLQPETLDLWTLPTIETVVQRVRGMGHDLKVIIALNRVPHQVATQAPEDVRRWMSENVAALDYAAFSHLVGRTAYGRAISEGLAVHEAQRPDTKAVAEIARLYQEVFR
jgi:chromosome partitioning protein